MEVGAVEHEADEADDDIEGGLVDVGGDGGEDGEGEELNFLADGGR